MGPGKRSDQQDVRKEDQRKPFHARRVEWSGACCRAHRPRRLRFARRLSPFTWRGRFRRRHLCSLVTGSARSACPIGIPGISIPACNPPGGAHHRVPTARVAAFRRPPSRPSSLTPIRHFCIVSHMNTKTMHRKRLRSLVQAAHALEGRVEEAFDRARWRATASSSGACVRASCSRSASWPSVCAACA